MKKAVIIMLSCVIFYACTQKTTHTKSSIPSKKISLITDWTDPRSYEPSGKSILALYGCDTAPNAEYEFRILAISDRRLVPVRSSRLPDAASMEDQNTNGDPQFRERCISSFYDSVSACIKAYYEQFDTSKPASNSECFRVIAKELTYLANQKASETKVLVTSDLLEKSDLFDCYRSNIKDTKNIVAIFNDANLLPASLKGIKVIFLFNPRDRKEDELFSRMADVYRILLEQRGAIVEFKANL